MTAIQPIANHLWQSTLFAVAAGLLTLVLRKNAARTRYWLWLAASVKFLLPFSILVMFGSHFGPPVAASISPPITFVVEQVSQPFGTSVGGAILQVPRAPRAPSTNIFPATIWTTWAAGFVVVVCSWWRRSRSIREALSAASPLDLPFAIKVMTSPAILGPGVFGIWRPVLLLPEGITSHLTAPEMDAILAHELCHVRRRDNLATVAHMSVEALFWFHPLVWWLGARLMEERENACDEEVLRNGTEPQVYAEGILKICELYLAPPLPCVSGVTGSNLKKRIETIVAGSRGVELSSAKKAALAVVGAICLALPVLIGTLHAPRKIVHSEVSVPPLPTPGVKFRTASIERCRSNVSGKTESAPGRLVLNCFTTLGLIQMAYLKSMSEDPSVQLRTAIQRVELSWGAGWVGNQDHLYRIDARADPNASFATMQGPMLQSLLADRFGVKVRRVTRESPMYSLTVAKNGARLKRSSERSCTGAWLRDARFAQPGPQNCMAYVGPEEDYEALVGEAINLEQFCYLLGGPLGRPVVDKTGIAGSFDFNLRFASPVTPPDLRQLYPSLPEILEEQLGLKLNPSAGPREFLVVDRVEKPLPE